MKTGRPWVKLFFASIFVMGLCIATAGAQVIVPADLVQWDGSEWQLTRTDKGYEFAPTGEAPSGNVRETIKAWGVMNIVTDQDGPTGEIRISLYEATQDTCTPSGEMSELVLYYIAGSSLSFAVYSNDDPVGLFYFTGTQSAKGLKGKVVTLGGFQVDDDDPLEVEVYGINLKGTTKALRCTLDK